MPLAAATPSPLTKEKEEARRTRDLRQVEVADAKQARQPEIQTNAATGYMGQDSFTARPENAFKSVVSEPVSTFSLDVDTASYAFMRASLAQNRLPNPASVRTEELVNYFPYDYPKPASAKEPFKTTVSVFPSPWNEGRKIMHVGVEGYSVSQEERPRANLVFLIDTSGSMAQPNKLPLVQQSLEMLVGTLDPKDTVAIVTYAGQAGVALPPTTIAEKGKILKVIGRLGAGGSTAGAEGLRTAYDLAKQNFDEKGVNRIVLATDGDFNVGMTGHDDLKTYIAKQRKSGIFLSVLGFGMGNYKDDRMQVLAQNGNGVAAYIDTLSEARKILVDEATSSIVPIAKDVKIQVEFNPATVAEYRLVGYEKRLLNREDFNNDTVDAGEVGSGHSVTALCEFVPVGGNKTVDDLRYQPQVADKPAPKASDNGEYAFVKMRYKLPDADASKLMETPILRSQLQAQAGESLRFAAAVAAFADALRGGTQMEGWSWDDIAAAARNAQGSDRWGLRAEFMQLVAAARQQVDTASIKSAAIAD